MPEHDATKGLRLLEARYWIELAEWIQDPRTRELEGHPALLELLQKLRDMVPVMEVMNGVERNKRRLEVTDPEDLWARHEPNIAKREEGFRAARILHLGILQAVAEGEPEPATDTWRKYRAHIEKVLKDYLGAQEPTQGDPDYSRTGHAQNALELLGNLDVVQSFALSQVEPGADPDRTRGGADAERLDQEAEERFIIELIAEVAFSAFDAGRHMQAAWGKEFERQAAIHMNSLKAMQAGNGPSGPYQVERRKSSKARQKHAALVKREFAHGLERKSQIAALIIQKWDKVGDPSDRPTPPSQKTVQNWLSKEAI